MGLVRKRYEKAAATIFSYIGIPPFVEIVSSIKPQKLLLVPPNSGYVFHP
jgi:hypothetical protein